MPLRQEMKRIVVADRGRSQSLEEWSVEVMPNWGFEHSSFLGHRHPCSHALGKLEQLEGGPATASNHHYFSQRLWSNGIWARPLAGLGAKPRRPGNARPILSLVQCSPTRMQAKAQ